VYSKKNLLGNLSPTAIFISKKMTTKGIRPPIKKVLTNILSLYYVYKCENGKKYFKTTHLKIIVSKSNGYSIIPVVGDLARKTSCSVGM